MRIQLLVVAGLALAVFSVANPATAQLPADFTPTPFGPDSGHFALDVSVDAGTNADCAKFIKENHTSATGTQPIFTTNKKSVACGSGEIGKQGNRQDLSQVHSSKPFQFYLMPAFDNVVMDTTKSITMDLHLSTDKVGLLVPEVTLDIGDWNTTWVADSASTDTSGSKVWHSWEVDLGTPPETINGSAKVTITIPQVRYSTSDPSAEPARLSATEITLGIFEDDHKTSITLPFGVQPVKEVAPETITCTDAAGENVTYELNETISSCDDVVVETIEDSNETVENVTKENVTATNETVGHDEHGDNNTTVAPEEEGLPGFNTVFVIAATGLLAIAGHMRRRGRDSS